MILAIDIGNTNIVFAFYEKDGTLQEVFEQRAAGIKLLMSMAFCCGSFFSLPIVLFKRWKVW